MQKSIRCLRAKRSAGLGGSKKYGALIGRLNSTLRANAFDIL
jgi:hypothetical protein